MVTAQPLSSEASALHRVRLARSQGGVLGSFYQCFGTWYYGWRHTSEISQQLRLRSAETRAIWRDAGYDLDIAERVCQAVEAACGWPNHWFVPDDPLDIVVDAPFDALAIVEFLGECEDRVGVKLEPGALQSATTVGDVVRIVTGCVHNRP
ncbi:MAG: acyl carrier protein [Phycisphaerales bacterium]|nr:acyl carrier protein [Phycisphaerales bacterium]